MYMNLQYLSHSFAQRHPETSPTPDPGAGPRPPAVAGTFWGCRLQSGGTGRGRGSVLHPQWAWVCTKRPPLPRPLPFLPANVGTVAIAFFLICNFSFEIQFAYIEIHRSSSYWLMSFGSYMHPSNLYPSRDRGYFRHLGNFPVPQGHHSESPHLEDFCPLLGLSKWPFCLCSLSLVL